MKNLSSRLNNRVNIYGYTIVINAIGETDRQSTLIATLWADIVPRTGKLTEVTDDRINYDTISHEITFRAESAPYIKPEYTIEFNGERFEIDYVLPNYNMRDRIVAYCRVIGI